jgi:hypothetical protein
MRKRMISGVSTERRIPNGMPQFGMLPTFHPCQTKKGRVAAPFPLQLSTFN